MTTEHPDTPPAGRPWFPASPPAEPAAGELPAAPWGPPLTDHTVANRPASPPTPPTPPTPGRRPAGAAGSRPGGAAGRRRSPATAAKVLVAGLAGSAAIALVGAMAGAARQADAGATAVPGGAVGRDPTLSATPQRSRPVPAAPSVGAAPSGPMSRSHAS